MDDKNRDQRMLANLYDMRQHVEFAHAIGVAMQNNCPIVEWRSWKYVPENLKKAVMDQLLVSIIVDEVDGGCVEGKLKAVAL
ncbi:serine hydroxymethyltransferase 7-like [Pyrus ussuriensis x Pyrus communis]|uniref:Serine hydroxymethyltransferase 7-like n=1 Tax=Pyrus ussuriensis x Pyrus communis TaxID=2448454 RepID=A0A5N5HG10_9ROSA|nr:serine hydroxymethyltransferase 7-like [Pyrus ussuriensis x Pyrus communis]